MSSKKKFEVGQEVVVTRPYGQPREQRNVVVKVGRSIVYTARVPGSVFVDSFYMESGRETGSYSHSHVYTIEEWDEREEQAHVMTLLRRRGIEVAWNRGKDYDLPRLRALVAATEGVEEK